VRPHGQLSRVIRGVLIVVALALAGGVAAAGAGSAAQPQVSFSWTGSLRAGQPFVVRATSKRHIVYAACFGAVARRYAIRSTRRVGERSATCTFVAPARTRGMSFRVAMTVVTTCAAEVPLCDASRAISGRVR
jgi:hypothetical protein